MGTLREYPGCILHLHLTGHSGGSLVRIWPGSWPGRRRWCAPSTCPRCPLSPRRERLAVQLSDRFLRQVICVSQETRQEHVTRLGRDPRKCVVVPNCVDLERFSPRVSPDPVRRELGLDPQYPVIGTVSRLHETRKGMAYFLEMAALVGREVPRRGSSSWATARCGGPGAPASAAGIAGEFIFTGQRADVPALLAAMDVFVMPSLYEGGPYTVLEAMAMGKPVVSTPVGLVPDAVEPGVSAVPLADGAALAGAVRRLLDDPSGRLPDGGQRAGGRPAALLPGGHAGRSDGRLPPGGGLTGRPGRRARGPTGYSPSRRQGWRARPSLALAKTSR